MVDIFIDIYIYIYARYISIHGITYIYIYTPTRIAMYGRDIIGSDMMIGSDTLTCELTSDNFELGSGMYASPTNCMGTLVH